MEIRAIAYRAVMISATAVLAGAVATAQMPPSGQPSAGQQAPQQPTNPSGQGPGAYPGTAPTGQDFGAKVFISKGMEGDQSEIQMGQLAQQKSQSNDVKQLAQKLVNDHTQMDEKWFKPLAKQMDVSEPKGPSKKDKKMAEKMEALSGNDFDTQYLTMMLKDHQKDLKEFQDEANSAQDPSLKQIAQQGASVISQHLQLIQQVAKNHNINTGETAKSGSM
jgi:putative membrane protein